ncbi:type II secretion system protein GspL [Gammaproteobacteria bacterium]|nr:type II secretion system protein GspL [Gammaproteobacteria bacterium]
MKGMLARKMKEVPEASDHDDAQANGRSLNERLALHAPQRQRLRFYVCVTAPHRWALVRDTRIVDRGSSDQLDDVDWPVGDFDLVGIVPASGVSIFRVDLPPGSLSTAEQAAPFAVEELVASSVDDLHVSVIDHQREGASVVSVIRKDALRGWIRDFAAHDQDFDELLPEQLLLPVHPGTTATVAQMPDGSCLIRERDGGCLLADASMVELWAESQDRERVIAINDANLLRQAPALNELSPRLWDVGDTVIDWLDHQVQDGLPSGLMTGELVMHRRARFPLWRHILLCCAIAVVLLLASSVFQWVKLKSQQSSINSRAVEVLAQFDTQAPDGIDPLDVLSRVLGRRLNGASNDYAFLLDQLGQYGPSSDKELQNLQFIDNSVVIDVRTDSIGRLNEIRTTLDQVEGVSAEVIEQQTLSDRVTGNIRLRRPSL